MTTAAPRLGWLPLTGFIAPALVAGGLGAWATSRNVRTWYPLLHKPNWNPPAWLFGPTWTLLYLLMGAAVWQAWRIHRPAVRAIVALYFVQLVVNASWSVLFFGLRQPSWALADIAVLWALLAWIQAGLARIDRLAAWLWLPYLLWVSFATVLNFAIVLLN
jgi:tryptophan-rich sensory protein